MFLAQMMYLAKCTKKIPHKHTHTHKFRSFIFITMKNLGVFTFTFYKFSQNIYILCTFSCREEKFFSFFVFVFHVFVVLCSIFVRHPSAASHMVILQNKSCVCVCVCGSLCIAHPPIDVNKKAPKMCILTLTIVHKNNTDMENFPQIFH